ncbi:MAG TPA: NYN domain-containing protein [Clostridia bacterium]|nr:NYN domain-containing protein [Clostridia bacterium]
MAKIRRNFITIVDGYNVINAWPELKEYVHSDLEHARDLLIEKLVNYKFITNENIIVVFDAHYVKDNPGTQKEVKGIEVVYTKEKTNADSYIEEKVALLAKDLRNVIKVVTYDFAEQQNILGSGASRVTPKEFKYRIIDSEKRLKLIYIEEERRKNKKNNLGNVINKKTYEKLKKLLDKDSLTKE